MTSFKLCNKMSYIKVFISSLCIAACVHSDKISSSELLSNTSGSKSRGNINKFYNGDHDYGYAEVRTGAFMFWWLYYAGGDRNTAYEKPFVIWIQGGPSIPGSGVGNFMEIGPQDLHLKKRNSSWVNKRNVLFIDSPVGTGFSYVNDSALLVKNDKELAYDLVELMKQFLQKFPKFETVPTHIFSQSYGGKIAPRFAYYLHKEIKAGIMKMNLKSVGMGSAFVSPKDSTLAYPEYMYNMGYLDQTQYASVKNITQLLAKFCDKRLYKKAEGLRHEMLNQLSDGYLNFNIFNVITPPIYYEIEYIQQLMNRRVKRALLDVVPAETAPWVFSNETIVQAMRGDIMRPSIHLVEKLLNDTDITLVVYNGNLDAATPIAGAVNWVHRLKWQGAEKFKQTPRKTIRGNGNGHYKSHGRLSFWWVYKAGHWVPSENPEAMEHILNVIVDSEQENENTHHDFQREFKHFWDLINTQSEDNPIFRKEQFRPNFTINYSINKHNSTTPTPFSTENNTTADISSTKSNWSTEYLIPNQTASWNILSTTEKQDAIDDNTVLDDVVTPTISEEIQE